MDISHIVVDYYVYNENSRLLMFSYHLHLEIQIFFNAS